MLASFRPSLIATVGRTLRYNPPKKLDHIPPPAQGERNFDLVTLSTDAGKENQFHKELVGRISQEIRTTTTTSDIRTLRQAVASGEYKPNASAIAARILFLGEDA